ncbi:MAG: peptidoglycan DD-metalloendopeptidase family protein [Holosporales bacterium]|jgi:murein DD-endopeptidase MepM/ murein hydrolase activator NlpD|nr:peptidoglycan DD-metalloendopeptidase family protein [Holosporales bacterium]
MVARRSHFLSIALLSVAFAIAVTEYLSGPIVTSPEFDGVSFPSENTNNVEAQDEAGQDNADATLGEGKTEEEALAQKSNTSENGEHRITVESGNSIASILKNIGVSGSDVHLISRAISKVYDLKNLKVGQEIVVRGKSEETGAFCVETIEFQYAAQYASWKINVEHSASGFKAYKTEIPLKKVVRNISGVITPNDPPASLRRSGLKPEIAREALRALAQVADIRGAKSGVSFEILYRDFYREDGSVARSPELVYASLLINGKIVRVYKFNHGGKNEYVDQNGVVIKSGPTAKATLGAPLGSMKVTSNFGMRRDPTNGRVKLHTGVDLSAVVGTPVRATANGRVVVASYYAGYGKYVNIEHSGAIRTAYGHLSRIVVRPGQRVTRGQIIAYSGFSGHCRGAHLHYEVISNGRHVNPLSFVKHDTQRLTGTALLKFNRFKKEVNLQVVGLTPSPSKGKGKAARNV